MNVNSVFGAVLQIPPAADSRYEGLTAYDARRREIRTRDGAEAMIDEVVYLLKEVEEALIWLQVVK